MTEETAVKNKKNTIPTIEQIEEQIWKREGVRIVLRLPQNLSTPLWGGQGYTYERALNYNNTISHLHDRLSKGVFGHPVSFVLIDGKGRPYHCRTGRVSSKITMEKLRKTYV